MDPVFVCRYALELLRFREAGVEVVIKVIQITALFFVIDN